MGCQQKGIEYSKDDVFYESLMGNCEPDHVCNHATRLDCRNAAVNWNENLRTPKRELYLRSVQKIRNHHSIIFSYIIIPPTNLLPHVGRDHVFPFNEARPFNRPWPAIKLCYTVVRPQQQEKSTSDPDFSYYDLSNSSSMLSPGRERLLITRSNVKFLLNELNVNQMAEPFNLLSKSAVEAFQVCEGKNLDSSCQVQNTKAMTTRSTRRCPKSCLSRKEREDSSGLESCWRWHYRRNCNQCAVVPLE